MAGNKGDLEMSKRQARRREVVDRSKKYPEFLMVIEEDPACASIVDEVIKELSAVNEKPHYFDLAGAIIESLVARDLCPLEWMERTAQTSVETHFWLTNGHPSSWEGESFAAKEKQISAWIVPALARNPKATVSAERLLIDALSAHGFAYAGIRSWGELIISDNWLMRHVRTYPGKGGVCQVGASKFVAQSWVDKRMERLRLPIFSTKNPFTGYPMELYLADMALEGPEWVREISRLGFCMWEWFPEDGVKSWALIARPAEEEPIPWPKFEELF